MRVKRDFEKASILRVLPSRLLVRFDCLGRNHKNYLITELDTFLYETLMGDKLRYKLVDTAYEADDLRGKLMKRCTAHYFFIAVVNRLMKQDFFKQFGIQVLKNKNKNHYTQIELVTEKGSKINFCYGKKYKVAMTNFEPFRYGLTA